MILIGSFAACNLQADDDVLSKYLVAGMLLERHQERAASELKADRSDYLEAANREILWMMARIDAHRACQNFYTWVGIDYYSAGEVAKKKTFSPKVRANALSLAAMAVDEADAACEALRTTVTTSRDSFLNDEGNVAADAYSMTQEDGRILRFSRRQVEISSSVSELIKTMSELEQVRLNDLYRSDIEKQTSKLEQAKLPPKK